MSDQNCEFEVKRSHLKAFLKLAESLQDEVKIKMDDEGLYSKSVDPAHVAMIELRLKAAGLVSRNDGRGEWAFDAGQVSDFVSVAQTENMMVQLKDQKLHLKWGRRKAQVDLGDIRGLADPKIPNIDLKNRVEVPFRDMVATIRDVKKFKAEHVTLRNINGNFGIQAEVNENIYEYESETKVETDDQSLFSSEYLKTIFSGLSHAASGNVILEYGNDYPLRIQFESNTFKIMYLLAPRIEND